MAEATTKKKEANVYERIANVQQGIKTVIKSGYNKHFGYPFATERDIIAEIKPLLGKEGLAVTHSLEKEEQVGQTTKLTIVFRVTNVRDAADFVEARGIGYGLDNQDKGAPKAYTMAVKYFLSKMFLVETGDDAEHDRGTAKKGQVAAAQETPEQLFEKARRMIAGTMNVDGLLEYAENLEKSRVFNAAQKKELSKFLKDRVDQLEK